MTEDERRDRKREQVRRWHAEHPDRVREIKREHMRRVRELPRAKWAAVAAMAARENRRSATSAPTPSPPAGEPGVKHAILSLARAVRRETDHARRELPASSPDDIATCRQATADLARQALELSRVVEGAWWAKVPSPADRRRHQGDQDR